MFDFPANPNVGDIYTPPGVIPGPLPPTYKWSGYAWDKMSKTTTTPPIQEAPSDTKLYCRRDNAWVEATEEAIRGNTLIYVRVDEAWVEYVPVIGNGQMQSVFYDLSNVASTQIIIPDWARIVSFEGLVYVPSQSIHPEMAVWHDDGSGGGGGWTTSGINGGSIVNSGSQGFESRAETAADSKWLIATLDDADVAYPQMFQGTFGVWRPPGRAQRWMSNTHAASRHIDPTIGLQNFAIQSMLSETLLEPIQRILRVSINSGPTTPNFLPRSYVSFTFAGVP